MKTGLIILVGGEKGGTGKTNIAVNLAAMCGMAGKETLLVDTDRQESATIWAGARSENRAEQGLPPDLVCMSKTGKVAFDIFQLREKFDVIVIDAGGRDSLELRQAMAICNIMVVPLRPSQFDTWSMNNVAKLLIEVGEKIERKVDARPLFSLCSSNPSVKEAEEARAYLAENYPNEFTPLAATVCERVSFRRAARDGMAVVEITGQGADPKAVQEMNAVYKEVFNEKWKIATAKAA